jgi:hypothetical protein
MKKRSAFMVAAASILSVSSVVLPGAAQPNNELETVACDRFPVEASSAHRTGIPKLRWRTDFPAAVEPKVHAWEGIDFRTEWQSYMAAVLAEVQAAGLKIQSNDLVMDNAAEWWIAPWMDYGPFGREARLGLTKERGPDEGDLSPTSPRGAQVWAIGFYNREGAKGLHDVFLDPCNPSRPATGWTFPAKTVSFKLLFIDTSAVQVPYLQGAPTVTAYIDPPGTASADASIGDRELRVLKLLQLDVAIRDPRAPLGWVFGTFVWQNNQSGLYGDLTPVGLMWGNDPAASANTFAGFAELPSTRLNQELAGIIWQGDEPWPQRPWPGFQGRLNGPADNLRSSCMSCHALAQWPRSRILGILPRPSADYTLQALANPARRELLRAKWMRDTQSGQLTDPTEASASGSNWGGATPLDYSLQLEASFTRMCAACKNGALSGLTPAVCKVAGAANRVEAANCPAARSSLAVQPTGEIEPPRQ